MSFRGRGGRGGGGFRGGRGGPPRGGRGGGGFRVKLPKYLDLYMKLTYLIIYMNFISERGWQTC